MPRFRETSGLRSFNDLGDPGAPKHGVGTTLPRETSMPLQARNVSTSQTPVSMHQAKTDVLKVFCVPTSQTIANAPTPVSKAKRVFTVSTSQTQTLSSVSGACYTRTHTRDSNRSYAASPVATSTLPKE